MRWALALLAAALLLPGCLSPQGGLDAASAPQGERAPLSEPTHKLGEFVSTKFPGHDGTPLHLDLQLPDGEGPFPVLVMYSPYTNNLNADDEAWGTTGGAAAHASFVDFYVPRGYAVGIAHVRGSGQSGGCFTLGGPDEAKDGYALVEWLANQSWSNGKVALLGTSYLGTTPVSTATLNPPHLATIVPVSAVTEWYRYYFENGEPRFFGELPFGVVYTDHPLWMGINVVPKPRNPASLADQPARTQCAADIAQNAYAQDDYNAWWMARNYAKDVPNATVPMLYAHGFLDENTPTSLVPDFFNAYGGEKRMWLQQHGHGVPSSFEAYHAHVHRWLDHYMLGLDNGALDLPAVVIEDNLGKYHAAPEWPQADAPTLALHLGPATLQNETPAEGRVSWRDGSLEEVRQKGVPQPGTFLRFTSEPLAADLHLSGAPRVSLVVASTAKDTQLDVLLYEMDASGKLTFITRGYLDARHRESLEHGKDVEPGKEETYAFILHARDHHVAAGNRLVLDLTSQDKYVLPDAPGATNTLLLGPSTLELPLLDLATATFSDDAPSMG